MIVRGPKTRDADMFRTAHFWPANTNRKDQNMQQNEYFELKYAIVLHQNKRSSRNHQHHVISTTPRHKKGPSPPPPCKDQASPPPAPPPPSVLAAVEPPQANATASRLCCKISMRVTFHHSFVNLSINDGSIIIVFTMPKEA
jgi:hypothetical protein